MVLKSSALIWIYRGVSDPEPMDFLKETFDDFEGDIITNPPYKYALEFVQQALNSVQEGHKVAMFLKLQFLEGTARRKLFDQAPPKRIYVSSGRLYCAKKMVTSKNIKPAMQFVMHGLCGKRDSQVILSSSG